MLDFENKFLLRVSEKKMDETTPKPLDSSSKDSSLSSSSSSSSSSDEEELETKERKIKLIKPIVSSSDTDDDDDEEAAPKRAINAAPKYVKTRDEVTVDEMPPVESIDITLDGAVKVVEVGRVISKVDKLIVVQSLPTSMAATKEDGSKPTTSVPPLNEETVLFDSNRKSIGKIFEVFGPVAGPFYSLRFNTLDEIETRALNVSVGASVFYAPDRQDCTKFIFNVDEMRREKGSDASWLNDNEPPVECIDYSDDEAERAAKKAASKKTVPNNDGSDSGKI